MKKVFKDKMTTYISSVMAEMKNCCKCHKDKANDESKEGRKTCITCLARVAEYQKNKPDKNEC